MKVVEMTYSERLILLFFGGSLISVYLVRILYNIPSLIFTPTSSGIDFCYFCFDQFPISKNIPFIQFLLFPILFLSILKIKNLLIPFLLSFAIVSLYFYWIYETFAGRKMFETVHLENETVFSFLMNNSTIFDFASFMIVFVIFIILTFLSCRFVIGEFHVKIS